MPEHARELADAEQKPFYVLSSRMPKIRAAWIALGLAIIVPLALIVSPLAIEQARHAMRQRAVPAALTITSRDRTVDRQASIGIAAGGPASHRHDPAPTAVAGPSPAGRGLDPAAMTLGAPRRLPDGPSFPAVIADRFPFWREPLRQADPFSGPFPAVDTEQTITRPGSTIAQRVNVATVQSIPGDRAAIRQNGNDPERPK